MKKKVLFTATVDSHIKNFHLPYLKYFKDNGYEVHVATNGKDKIPHCDVKHTVSLERSPFRINNLKARKQLKKIIDSEGFEIIHTHTPMGSVITRLAAIKARKAQNTRVIYTAHGFHFYKGAPIQNWILYYPVERFLARYTDTLITINKEDYQRAKSKFKTRVEYVPGVGLDEKKFDFKMTKKEKSELRKSLGLKDTDYVLICVAELNKNKNQKLLIDAMSEVVKKNKDIHLLLVGLDSYNGRHRKQVTKLGLEGNVHFLGFRKDVPKILKISDLAVSASKREGLPLNLVEAQFVGLPIIASGSRGNRDISGINVISKLDKYAFANEIMKHSSGKIKNISYSKKIKDKYIIRSVMNKVIENVYNAPKKVLIIPDCTDLNRGDQALVYETKKIIDEVYEKNKTYALSHGNNTQLQKEGIHIFTPLLKHPSRFSNKKSNLKYSTALKVYWGVVAVFDLFFSLIILNQLTRNVIYSFLPSDLKETLELYKESESIFVKGGGFLHDYTGGLIGAYTMYYHTYHLKLATSMGKKLYIMPNSFGPFRSNFSKKMLNSILDKASLVTSRESISASSQTNGLGRDIDLYPDLAFFLYKRSSSDYNKIINSSLVIPDKNKVAITVRPYRYYGYKNPESRYLEYKKAFSGLIRHLQVEGSLIYLVVHTLSENTHENDEACIKEIYKMLPSKENVFIVKSNNYDCYDLKDIYSKCNYIIGTRFHSVIFAMQQNIPSLAITYGGNKGEGIMADMSLSQYALPIDELDLSSLITKYEDMKNNQNQIDKTINRYKKNAVKKRKELVSIIKKTGLAI